MSSRSGGGGGGGRSPPDPASAAAGTRTDMVQNARGRPKRDGEMRVLVTRHWPRGHRREEFVWMRTLSPSAALLRRYKAGEIDWREFAGLYAEQIAADRTAQMIIAELHDAAASGEREVVLYCHEAPGKPCHRHILREMVVRGRATAGAARCDRFEDGRGRATGAFTQGGHSA